MRATALMFQGKLDPSWLLDASEIKQLTDAICRLPGTMSLRPKDARYLGYQGVVVQIDPVDTMLLYQGMAEIATNNNAEVRRFYDINRELEEWVFMTAQGRIDNAIFNQVVLGEFVVRRKKP